MSIKLKGKGEEVAGQSFACACDGVHLCTYSCSFLSHHLFITKCSSASLSSVWGNYFTAPSNHLSNAHFQLKGGEELEVGVALCTY